MRYAALFGLFIAACSAPARSVDWFVQHPDETAAVQNRCIMRVQTGAECANALEASRKASDNRMKLFRKGF